MPRPVYVIQGPRGPGASSVSMQRADLHLLPQSINQYARIESTFGGPGISHGSEESGPTVLSLDSLNNHGEHDAVSDYLGGDGCSEGRTEGLFRSRLS